MDISDENAHSDNKKILTGLSKCLQRVAKKLFPRAWTEVARCDFWQIAGIIKNASSVEMDKDFRQWENRQFCRNSQRFQTGAESLQL